MGLYPMFSDAYTSLQKQKGHMRVLSAIAFFLTLNTSPAALLTESFETPDVTPFLSRVFEFFPTPGWTMEAGSFTILIEENGTGSHGHAQDGEQWLRFTNYGAIYSVVPNLIPGQRYAVDYWVSAIADYSQFGLSTITLELGDTFATTSIDIPKPNSVTTIGSTGSPWIEVSFEFIATSIQEPIRIIGDSVWRGSFLTEQGPGSQPAIDNLTVTSVPEPSAVGLLMIGIAVHAIFRRNRRTTTAYKG